MGDRRPFFLRRSDAVGGGPGDSEKESILSGVPEGVGPRTYRMLRLCLDAKGYPRGDMLREIQAMPLTLALELEDVAHFRQRQIKALTDLETRRLKTAAK